MPIPAPKQCDKSHLGGVRHLCLIVVLAIIFAVACAIGVLAQSPSQPAKPITPPTPTNEAEWTNHIAPKLFGVGPSSIEVVIADGSRVDILTHEYAIEVDWCKDKWKESIGQSLLYSIATNREPAVLLLVRDPENSIERLHAARCMAVCGRANITYFAWDCEHDQPIPLATIPSTVTVPFRPSTNDRQPPPISPKEESGQSD